MISSLHFRNFKSLRDLRIEGLGQLTVIVGPSGVGKTSVLQGLEVLGEVLKPEGPPLDAGPIALPRLQTIGAEGPLDISVIGEDSRSSLRLNLEVPDCRIFQGDGSEFRIQLSDRRLMPMAPTFKFMNRRDQASHVRSQEDAQSQAQNSESGLHLSGGKVLRLNSASLGAGSLAEPNPHIAADGTGLATMLAYLAGADRDALESIEAELRSVLDVTGRIRSYPAELEIEEREQLRIDDQLVPRITRRRAAAHRFELEIDEIGPVPGDLLSEGTLVTLGLLTALHQPDGPTLILLDDIDRGLHPDAQARLLKALRRLLAGRPELQLMCTSHSPYLVDHVEPEEVQVMSFVDGQVSAARLDHHADWEKWRGKLQTGEFWQSAGEDWVPAQAAADGE